MPLGSFPAGPAEVTPYLGINVRISGAAEAGAQLSVVAPFDVGAAIDKAEGGHAVTSTGRPRFQPEIGLPDAANALAFQVSVELELTMSFMLSISDIPIGGPVLAASLGARLEVDLGAADWWVLQGLAGLEAGWSWPEADGSPQPPAFEELFPRREWRIDDADDDGPVGDVSTRWSHSFGIHNGDDAGAIVADGDELAIVERDNSNWMATLDGLGNPTWQEQQSNLVGYVDAVTRTADDDLVIAGTHSPGVRVERFDAAERDSWAKQIDIDDVESGLWSAVVPTAGGVIVAGNVRHPSGEERAALIDVGDDGTVRWVTEIDPGATYPSVEISAVSATPRGDLLVVGKTLSYPDSAHENSEAFVMRVDRNGTVRTAFAVGRDASGSGEAATAVAVQPDGSYAISGQAAATAGDHYSWVAEFSPNDQLRWSSTYLDRPASELASHYGMATGIAPVDGGYVVTGFTGMSSSDSWVMRVDRTGMPVWSKSFIGTGTDLLTDAVAMPTGVAAFGQTTTSDPIGSTFADLWVVRMSADGMVHFDAGSGFDTVNGAVQWHRNTTHAITPLTPTQTFPAATVTDAPAGTVPAAAVNNALA